MQLNKFEKITAIFATFGIISVVAMVGYISSISKSSIAVIDMKQAINTPVTMISKTKLSESSKNKVIAAYSKSLPKVIRKYGKDNHLTIVSTPVLFSGDDSDITKAIIKKTFAEVKSHANK